MKIRQGIPADSKGISEVHVYSWKTTYKGIISDSDLEALTVGSRPGRLEMETESSHSGYRYFSAGKSRRKK